MLIGKNNDPGQKPNLICLVKPLSKTTGSELRSFDLGQILTTVTYPYFILKLLQGRIDQVFVQ